FVFERSPTTTTTERVLTEAAERHLRTRRHAGIPAAVAAGWAEPRAIRPPRALLRGIHPELASIDLLAVEAPNGFRRLGFIRKLDECKTPRPAGLAVRPQVYMCHLAGGGKRICELLFSCTEIEVADKDLR